MTQFESKMFEKFSEAVEDAISSYLNDDSITEAGLEEYFGKETFIDKIKSYLDVIKLGEVCNN